MPSFDIVSKVDLQEVDNAVNQAIKEITTRYDFKGSKSEIKHEGAEINLLGDDDHKLKALIDVLQSKLIRRGIDLSSLDYGKEETASGGMVRQKITVKQGINQEAAKKVVKVIKEGKLKVQAAIQGDTVRVTGKKRDDLQEAIAMIRAGEFGQPLQYENFRD